MIENSLTLGTELNWTEAALDTQVQLQYFVYIFSLYYKIKLISVASRKHNIKFVFLK